MTAGHPFGVLAPETLSGHRTITQAEADANNIFTFDPGGSARNVIMPAEAANAGRVFFIYNSADGAEVITVQTDAPATICTPAQNECAIVWCDGTNWGGIAGARS